MGQHTELFGSFPAVPQSCFQCGEGLMEAAEFSECRYNYHNLAFAAPAQLVTK